jgi:hypothetical protein
VSQETSAELLLAVQFLAMSEKCCISMGRNLNRYVVKKDEKAGKANAQI